MKAEPDDAALLEKFKIEGAEKETVVPAARILADRPSVLIEPHDFMHEHSNTLRDRSQSRRCAKPIE